MRSYRKSSNRIAFVARSCCLLCCSTFCLIVFGFRISWLCFAVCRRTATLPPVAAVAAVAPKTALPGSVNHKFIMALIVHVSTCAHLRVSVVPFWHLSMDLQVIHCNMILCSSGGLWLHSPCFCFCLSTHIVPQAKTKTYESLHRVTSVMHHSQQQHMYVFVSSFSKVWKIWNTKTCDMWRVATNTPMHWW